MPCLCLLGSPQCRKGKKKLPTPSIFPMNCICYAASLHLSECSSTGQRHDSYCAAQRCLACSRCHKAVPGCAIMCRVGRATPTSSCMRARCKPGACSTPGMRAAVQRSTGPGAVLHCRQLRPQTSHSQPPRNVVSEACHAGSADTAAVGIGKHEGACGCGSVVCAL
jgi:hypothetical protein